MDKVQIIEAISSFFIAVDEHNWDRVEDIFCDKVLLDYTSMSGGQPEVLSAEDIISSWKAFLPGFDFTHHQVSNFTVEPDKNDIKVFCYGTGTHYMDNESGKNIWTVTGTYNIRLDVSEGVPRISALKFNLKFTDGNKGLPGLAVQRLKTL